MGSVAHCGDHTPPCPGFPSPPAARQGRCASPTAMLAYGDFGLWPHPCTRSRYANPTHRGHKNTQDVGFTGQRPAAPGVPPPRTHHRAPPPPPPTPQSPPPSGPGPAPPTNTSTSLAAWMLGTSDPTRTLSDTNGMAAPPITTVAFPRPNACVRSTDATAAQIARSHERSTNAIVQL